MGRFRYNGRFAGQWLALVAALIMLGLVIGYNLYAMRATILKQEQHRLLTQGRVISQNMEHQLQTTSTVLHGLLMDLPELTSGGDNRHLNRRLQLMTTSMPGVNTLLVVDAKGKVTASSRSDLIGFIISKRDYFETARRSNDPEKLYISPPFNSLFGSYIFTISKIIPAENGRFNGIVVAGIDPVYFETILRSTLYAPDMWNTINHSDGIRFMGVPFREGQAGLNLAVPGSIFSRHLASGQMESVLYGHALTLKEERLVAALTVNPKQLNMDKSLMVIISRDPKVVLADWRKEAWYQSTLFALTCAASAIGLRLYLRRKEEFEQKTKRADDLVLLRYQLLEYATMHTSEELLLYAVNEVCRLSDSTVGLFYSVEPGQDIVTLQAWINNTRQDQQPSQPVKPASSRPECPLCEECLITRAPVVNNDFISLPGKKGVPPGYLKMARGVMVPVIRDEQVVALLAVGNKLKPYSNRDAEEILYLADVSWEIIESRRVHEELEKANELLSVQARLDFLTGIYNRRMFDGLLNAEAGSACRYGHPLSLIIMDLDHFKRVNDSYGHGVGDTLLQQVSQLVSGRLRSNDIFCRWGGEEFVILCPQNDLAQAATLAEILRDMIEKYDFGDGLRATASFGVTQYSCDEPFENFIGRADDALYQAKRNGRNRVELLLPLTPPV